MTTPQKKSNLSQVRSAWLSFQMTISMVADASTDRDKTFGPTACELKRLISHYSFNQNLKAADDGMVLAVKDIGYYLRELRKEQGRSSDYLVDKVREHLNDAVELGMLRRD